MCTALENLKQEGRREGMITGMVTAYRELDVPDCVILERLQDKFKMSRKEAQTYLQ